MQVMIRIAVLGTAIGVLLTAAGSGLARQYYLGDIPMNKEMYRKHQKSWPVEMAAVLPLSYDARDEGLVTPAKNQGQCGSCWAFASVGALEAHMLKAYQAGPEDLSEQQQVSCNTSMWGCDGGSANAIRYWEYRGPLHEEFFPYTASDATPCTETEEAQLGYRVIDWHTVGSSDFKNSVYTYGPSYWRYDVHEDFYSFWENGAPDEVYVNSRRKYVGGHAVLLIGWDDAKGAYLCKNSWGETGGPNGDGTFWIAYSGHSSDLRFGMANFSLTSLGCLSDADCDDGVFCNGLESCFGEVCIEGEPVACADDGLFCNGEEVCNEATLGCGSTGSPCGAGEMCDEAVDQCISQCGNGVCDPGENCTSCPADCISGSGGGSCSACFKGACDGICHPVKEGPDCSDCLPFYCCGDGVCEVEENSGNCLVDCPVTICGDGICSPGEDRCGCPSDCGSPGPEICDNGIDDDCDGSIDCGDSDCAAAAACLCLDKNQACVSSSECCSGRCRNGKCR